MTLEALTIDDDQSVDAEGWAAFLGARTRTDWRPGEYDHAAGVLTPDHRNPYTALTVCQKTACGVRVDHAALCPTCRKSWRAASHGTDLSLDEWLQEPRVRREKAVGCLVDGCERDHHSRGLCTTHYVSAKNWWRVSGRPKSVEAWYTAVNPGPLPRRERCVAVTCDAEAARANQLCENHSESFSLWASKQSSPSAATFERWFRLEVEIPLGGPNAPLYSESAATAFYLLPEPARFELLYAVQQRDLDEVAHLVPVDLRSIYLHLRRNEVESLVGLDMLGYPAGDTNLRGLCRDLQHRIDDAYRAWSGTDARDPRIIYFSDIELRYSSKRHGRNSKVDLTGIQSTWILDSVKAWINAAPRGFTQLSQLAVGWTLVDEILRQRGTHVESLARADMDAIVNAFRKKWTARRTLGRYLTVVREVVEYGRGNPEELPIWQQIPPSFAILRARHSATGSEPRSAANADEPFRYVPQPIVDWVMDHITLYSRANEYLTAEARMMLFIQERCGRRTGETARLKDDCISYDSAGSPYLEWERGKAPWGPGKRLPIHQETHDAIREWQQRKASAGVKSQWLFPSTRGRSDRPHEPSFINQRLKELIEVIERLAPFESAVEGAEGNLVHFDLKSLDAYSFRHAFAQRHADATDEFGRPSTPPEVLQDYMGHVSYNTTMGYYEVTAARRKRAMAGISPRRLDFTGTAVRFDRERDGFGKLAVSHGTCTEPVNVLSGGDECAINHSCESCPFFLVDPLERDGMVAKRLHLKSQLERFRVIAPGSHMVGHLENRIDDCTRIIEGIDRYVDALPPEDRAKIRRALDQMTDIRQRATAPRRIDLRTILQEPRNG